MTTRLRTPYECHVLDSHDFMEVGLSSCGFGCKIYRCHCGVETLMHNPVYGCKEGLWIL